MQTRLNAISGDQSGRKTCLIVRKFACQPPLFALVRRASQLARTPVSRTFNSRLVRGAAPPPIPKIPTLIGWDFFCPLPQCWRGFRAWPRERHPCKVGVFAPTDVSLFSVFSGGYASVLEAISFAGAGCDALTAAMSSTTSKCSINPDVFRPRAKAVSGCAAIPADRSVRSWCYARPHPIYAIRPE